MTAKTPGIPEPLALTRKLSQPLILERIAAAQAGLRAGPVVVELDPTSFCDSACPGCISEKLLNIDRFERRRLLELAAELLELDVRAVILIGGGEPLAHPTTPELIQALHGGGLAVGLTTSGTLLDRHLELIAQAVSWTRVSLDAASPDTYARTRPHRSGRNMFERVTNAMGELAAQKTGTLGMSFMISVRGGGTNQ